MTSSRSPKRPDINITTLASTYPDQDYVQGLINTVALQREEIEALKQALAKETEKKKGVVDEV